MPRQVQIGNHNEYAARPASYNNALPGSGGAFGFKQAPQMYNRPFGLERHHAHTAPQRGFFDFFRPRPLPPVMVNYPRPLPPITTYPSRGGITVLTGTWSPVAAIALAVLGIALLTAIVAPTAGAVVLAVGLPLVIVGIFLKVFSKT